MHSQTLVVWKCSVSWGLVTEDEVCAPFDFPPEDDCSKELFYQRLQLFDVAFRWWEEEMGWLMYERVREAKAAGKVGRYTQSGECLREERSFWVTAAAAVAAVATGVAALAM